MKTYTVTWVIELDADSPEHAADRALAVQRDPESLATVFAVSESEECEPVIIDVDR